MNQKVVENISVNALKNFLAEYSGKKIFLVTGKQSYFLSGAADFMNEALDEFEVIRFFDFDQNPKFEEACLGKASLLSSECELIIAIGGGSVIDMAKLINVFAGNSEVDPLEIIKNPNKISQKGLPLVAIPTTAGTGSEATHFAVVYHDKVKFSVAHEFLLPDLVGLNSRFLRSQSSYLIACAGMDALSQGIESFWSVGASESSRDYSRRSIQIICKHLVNAVLSKNQEDFDQLIFGAFLAGKAINISKTTAPHAVSYAFTTFYNIPHGHAVFLTLPHFAEYNNNVMQADCNDPRGIDYVKNSMDELANCMGLKSTAEIKTFLLDLAKSINVELSPKKLGIDKFENKIASNVNLERLGNNPRKIEHERLMKLLKEL